LAHLDIGTILGRRTAELHRRACKRHGGSGFSAPRSRPTSGAWRGRRRTTSTMRSPRCGGSPTCPEAGRDRRSGARRADEIAERIAEAARMAPSGGRCRIHGDYHLGQVLVVQNDVAIIDFEGEPTAPLPNAPRRPRPCATWRGCCAPSTMRSGRPSSTASSSAPIRGDRRSRGGLARARRAPSSTPIARRWRARLHPADRGRASAARPLPDPEGRLRDRIRARDAARLGADPARRASEPSRAPTGSLLLSEDLDTLPSSAPSPTRSRRSCAAGTAIRSACSACSPRAALSSSTSSRPMPPR
jgi:hypothetical protein